MSVMIITSLFLNPVILSAAKDQFRRSREERTASEIEFRLTRLTRLTRFSL
jgi:hypothetical protein